MRDKGMARDSRLMAAFVQTLVGLFCLFVGSVISFASASALASSLGDAVNVLAVAVPVVMSSAGVYGIGRSFGYKGSFWVTLLSGILPTVGAFYALAYVMAMTGGFEDMPPMYSIFLFLASVLVVPAVEVAGFHIFDTLRSKLEQGSRSIEAAILEDEPDDVVRTIRCPNFDCKYGIEIERGKKGNKRQKIRCPECSRKIALPIGMILVRGEGKDAIPRDR